MCPYGTSSSGESAVCSGHGRCLSLGDVSNFVDYEQFFNAAVYTGWDAEMIYGCDCDSGWEGSGCHRKSCPKGSVAFFISIYVVSHIRFVQVMTLLPLGSRKFKSLIARVLQQIVQVLFS